MTPQELRAKFNESKEYPTTYAVDAATYGLVCQAVFNNCINTQTDIQVLKDYFFVKVSLGPNGGIYFKNVELILTVE